MDEKSLAKGKALASSVSEELKKLGLEVAEEASIGVVKAVVKKLPDLLRATDNKFDDILIPLINIVGPKVIEYLDKIDGEIDYPQA